MRIIAGDFRGRKLTAPKGLDVRPTADRARESLFNILGNGAQGPDFPGAVILDIFAGTGALGLEALSRGAARAIFVDTSKAALRCIQENIASLGVADRAQVMRRDARNPGPAPDSLKDGADLAFMDPPYGHDLANHCLPVLLAEGWLSAKAIVAVETETGGPPVDCQGMECFDTRILGATTFHLLRRD